MSEIIKTDCASCVHSCGLNVHLENGKIIKVEGMPEHPLSKGYLCPRGESLVEYVYSKDRLTHPISYFEEYLQISPSFLELLRT